VVAEGKNSRSNVWTSVSDKWNFYRSRRGIGNNGLAYLYMGSRPSEREFFIGGGVLVGRSCGRSYSPEFGGHSALVGIARGMVPRFLQKFSQTESDQATSRLHNIQATSRGASKLVHYQRDGNCSF
jgi:hypothetical protein